MFGNRAIDYDGWINSQGFSHPGYRLPTVTSDRLNPDSIRLNAIQRSIVRVLDFERAFAMLEEEHQLALALIYRDNEPQDKAADAIGCSLRKLCYLLPEARQHQADILNRLDLL